MGREHAAKKAADVQNPIAETEAVNARLTDYIRANAVRVDHPVTQPHAGRSIIGYVGIALLQVAGILVFGIATSISYIAGMFERRRSTRVWDRLGLPVVASDAGDDKDGTSN